MHTKPLDLCKNAKKRIFSIELNAHRESHTLRELVCVLNIGCMSMKKEVKFTMHFFQGGTYLEGYTKHKAFFLKFWVWTLNLLNSFALSHS